MCPQPAPWCSVERKEIRNNPTPPPTLLPAASASYWYNLIPSPLARELWWCCPQSLTLVLRMDWGHEWRRGEWRITREGDLLRWDSQEKLLRGGDIWTETQGGEGPSPAQSQWKSHPASVILPSLGQAQYTSLTRNHVTQTPTIWMNPLLSVMLQFKFREKQMALLDFLNTMEASAHKRECSYLGHYLWKTQRCYQF